MSTIFTKISSLPPLSETAQKLRSISSHEDFDPQEVTKLIEKDPMLLAEVLKSLNSAAYSFKSDIKSIKQAVMLLGFKPLKNLVTQITVRKALDADLEPYGITTNQFSQSSILQAKIVTKWHPNIEDSSTLELAAMLQDIGMLLIASEVIKDNETSQFLADLDINYDTERTEKSYVDTTAATLSAEILKHWKFNEELIELIKQSSNPSSHAGWILKIARIAASPRFCLTERSINKALKLAQKTDLDPQALENVLKEIA
ncbi:MAG: HDOD domain-containing protein [Campylobacterota bacterium]